MTLIDPRPLVEICPITDIYADGIGDVDNLAGCFRTIYFTYSRGLDGAMERVVVAKIIRPVRSILRGSQGVLAQMLAAKRPLIEPEALVLHS